MAAELDKLARQFKDPGIEDIAQVISAWIPTAKARGIEIFQTIPVVPEGAIDYADITIGGKTLQELESALASGGFKVSDYARDLLRSKDFTTLSDQQTLSLGKVKVSDLGITGNPTIAEIYTKASSLGLDLCPAEVGPQLRLADKNQPLEECYYVGMKQITDSRGRPSVFELDRSTDGAWLHGRWAGPDNQWNPEHEFVFALRKQIET